MNENDQATGRNGRAYLARVHGDSIDQLEVAALAEAAEFFGPGVPLRVSENYTATRSINPGDGRYRAAIHVHQASPDE